MDKNLVVNCVVSVVSVLGILGGSCLLDLGNAGRPTPNELFKSIPPTLLDQQDRKPYKFNIDVLEQRSFGENNVYVNLASKGDNIKLERGKVFTLTYGTPFGSNDFIRGSLLDGKLIVKEGSDGRVTLSGNNYVFLSKTLPGDSISAAVPNSIKKGSYQLVILLTYNEEDRGYYVTTVELK